VIGLAVSQWAIHGSRLWLAVLVVGIVALFAFSGLFDLLQPLLPRSRAAIAAMTRRWPWYDRFVWICAFVVWPTAGFAAWRRCSPRMACSNYAPIDMTAQRGIYLRPTRGTLRTQSLW
jgi:hypothetical protein